MVKSWYLPAAVKLARLVTATTALLVLPSLLVVIDTLADERLPDGLLTVILRTITAPEPTTFPEFVRPPTSNGIATVALATVDKDTA